MCLLDTKGVTVGGGDLASFLQGLLYKAKSGNRKWGVPSWEPVKAVASQKYKK